MSTIKKLKLTCVAGLLLAALPSFSQSVQLSGVVDVAVGAFKSTDTSKASTQVNASGLSESYLSIKGGEKLGNGVAVSYVLEAPFYADTGATQSNLFAKNAYVKLSTAHNSVSVGKIESLLKTDVLAKVDPFGVSDTFSASAKTFGSGAPSLDNSVKLSSSKFMDIDGLSMDVLYSPGENNTTDVAEGSLSYTKNGYTVFGYRGVEYGSPDMTVVPLNVGPFMDAKYKNTAIGVAKSYNAHSFALTYGKGVLSNADYYLEKTDYVQGSYKYKAADGMSYLMSLAKSKVVDSDVDYKKTEISLGLVKSLSKRTDIYALDNISKADGVVDGVGNSFAVGITHRF